MTKPQILNQYIDTVDQATTSYLIQGRAQVIQFIGASDSYITNQAPSDSIYLIGTSNSTFFNQAVNTHLNIDDTSINTTLQNWNDADPLATITLSTKDFPTMASVYNSLHVIPGYGEILDKPSTLQPILTFQQNFNVPPTQFHISPNISPTG